VNVIKKTFAGAQLKSCEIKGAGNGNLFLPASDLSTLTHANQTKKEEPQIKNPEKAIYTPKEIFLSLIKLDKREKFGGKSWR